MAQGEIHKDDIGTQFTASFLDGTATVNVSGATTKQLLFVKPSGAIVIQIGSDGTDTNQLTYTTVTGDLNETGEFKLQGFITIGGSSWHSDISTFTVHPNVN